MQTDFPDVTVVEAAQMAAKSGKVLAINGGRIVFMREPLDLGWHKIGVSVKPLAWECSVCGQTNSDWAETCGRCGNG
ncbi:MAG: hypothetical protein ACYC36_03755 [Bellilinea sp.]